MMAGLKNSGSRTSQLASFAEQPRVLRKNFRAHRLGFARVHVTHARPVMQCVSSRQALDKSKNLLLLIAGQQLDFFNDFNCAHKTKLAGFCRASKPRTDTTTSADF